MHVIRRLWGETVLNEANINSDATHTQAPDQVASMDQLEPVIIESNTSYAVTTTLVSDDEEDDQAIEASGKDAIDVPSQGVSPLLLLGGAALIGGGIAVLANDDSSSNDNPPEDNNEVVYVPELSISGNPRVGEIIELELSSSNDRVQGFYLGDDKQTLSRIETYSEVDAELQGGNTLAFSKDFIGHDLYAEISNGDETTMVRVVNGHDTLHMNYLDENLTTSWTEIEPGVFKLLL